MNCCENKTNSYKPETVSYADYKVLKQEYDNLLIQFNTKEEDLTCKIEIIAALEALILEKGTDEMKLEMTIKLAEVLKKNLEA